MEQILFISFLGFGISNGYGIANNHDAMMYLNRFGYINDNDVPDRSDMSMSSMKPMLMEFQKMCNINQTGVLDSKTMSMMNAPRCGNLDMNFTDHHSMFLTESPGHNKVAAGRYRRFALTDGGFKWTKRELKYKMSTFPQKEGARITKDEVLKEIHSAFKMWSEVTNLDFIYRPQDDKVDIELSFTKQFHEDDYPFDGPGSTLAHAFPPGEGLLGDVHFEDEEKWSVRSYNGVNVLFVAVHEIGHALGLAHSMKKGAIMQPFYGGYSPKLQLHSDDIEGIQSLYGIRDRRQRPSEESGTKKPIYPTKGPNQATGSPFPTRPPPTQQTTTEPYSSGGDSGRPDFCKDASVDAMTTIGKSVFAFKDNYVLEIDESGSRRGPHRIEAIFRGLEGNLDAVITRENRKTYFFKGSIYWRFTERIMDEGYPKKIYAHFQGIPDNIDSAFAWLNAMYFTKGDKVWRFDTTARPFVSEKYPISLSLWQLGGGVPRIDASFKAPNGNIYFFYDQVYWRFDERTFKVSNDANPPYPRSSKVYWFGCAKGGASVDFRNVRQPESFKYLADNEAPDWDYYNYY